MELSTYYPYQVGCGRYCAPVVPGQGPTLLPRTELGCDLGCIVAEESRQPNLPKVHEHCLTRRLLIYEKEFVSLES